MISIIVPTRDRADGLLKAFQTLGIAKNGLEALVWVDDDDPQLDQYKDLFESDPNVKLFIKERVGYANSYQMLNFLVKEAKYDWIFQFNDDAYMDKLDWFEVFKDFAKQFDPANQPIVMNIWGQGETDLNLFPIVSRKFVDILGYYAILPACDDYIRTVAAGAGISYNLNGIKPKHRKYGGDENPLTDKTFEEVQNDRKYMKRNFAEIYNPLNDPIKSDIAKIVEYNRGKA